MSPWHAIYSRDPSMDLCGRHVMRSALVNSGTISQLGTYHNATYYMSATAISFMWGISKLWAVPQWAWTNISTCLLFSFLYLYMHSCILCMKTKHNWLWKLHAEIYKAFRDAKYPVSGEILLYLDVHYGLPYGRTYLLFSPFTYSMSGSDRHTHAGEAAVLLLDRQVHHCLLIYAVLTQTLDSRDVARL